MIGEQTPDRLSVVVCAFSEQRWDALGEAVGSLRRQSPAPDQILLVVDHNDALLARVQQEFPSVTAVPNRGRRGLSSARNTGIAHATGDIVAFLDDDATAEPGWAAAVLDACRDPAVAGVGGPVLPRWERPPPAWLASELLWVVGCSYRGQHVVRGPIRNPIGANMAFRRTVLARVGGFTDELARTSGSRLVSCDETEYAIRVRQAISGAQIVSVPGMCAHHLVRADRTTWRYFRARCFGEGYAKALVARSVGVRDGLASERSYTLRTLPTGIVDGVRDATRGDRDGLRRSGAILAALAVTGAGYVSGRLAHRSA